MRRDRIAVCVCVWGGGFGMRIDSIYNDQINFCDREEFVNLQKKPIQKCFE